MKLREVAELKKIVGIIQGATAGIEGYVSHLRKCIDAVDFEALEVEVTSQYEEKLGALVKKHEKELASAVSRLQKEHDRKLKKLGEYRETIAEMTSNAHADHAERRQPELGLKKQHVSIAMKILIALYQEPDGKLTRAQIGFIAGISIGSGSVIKAYADLQESGYIEGRGVLQITPAGRVEVEARGEILPRPSGFALIELLCEREGRQLGVLLKALIDLQREDFGKGYSRADICARASKHENRHVSPGSGTTIKSFSRLMKLELIEGRGLVSLQKWLASMVLPIEVKVHDRSTGETRKVVVK